MSGGPTLPYMKYELMDIRRRENIVYRPVYVIYGVLVSVIHTKYIQLDRVLLVVAKLKPKLKAQKREEAQPNRYDIDLLRKDGEEKE